MINVKVVVLILNHNKKNDLLECLRSVLKQNNASFEVVVVDNGSTDGSTETVVKNFPDVHLLKLSRNLGVASGRNAGCNFIKKNFNYEYLLSLDNDVFVDKNFLSELLRGFSFSENTGITCGKTYSVSSSNLIISAGIKANLYTGLIKDIGTGEIDNGKYNKISEVDACGGFGFLINKPAFDSVDNFDERYNPYGWEDVDFCFRIRKNGYKILYIPNAVMYHKGTKAGRKPILEYERSKVKNYFLFLKDHTNFLQKLTCLFFIPPKIFFLFFDLVKQGNANIIQHQFKGLSDIFFKKKIIKTINGKNYE